MRKILHLFFVVLAIVGMILGALGVFGCSPVVRVYHHECRCDTVRIFRPNMQWMPDTTARNIWWKDSTRLDSLRTVRDRSRAIFGSGRK